MGTGAPLATFVYWQIGRRNAVPGKVWRDALDPIPISIVGSSPSASTIRAAALGADLSSDALRRIAVATQSIGIGAVPAHV